MAVRSSFPSLDRTDQTFQFDLILLGYSFSFLFFFVLFVSNGIGIGSEREGKWEPDFLSFLELIMMMIESEKMK